MVIEQDVPDVPDRQVQLADGFPDLPGFRMAAHPPRCCFQSEARDQQPVHHDVVDGPGGDAVVVLRRKRSSSPGRLPSRPGIVRWPHARLVQFRYRPVAGHA